MNNQFTLLKFLGYYYAISGLWAIISMDSFTNIVWRRTFELHSLFAMHTIAAMFLVLGLYFIHASEKKTKAVFPLAATLPIAIFIIELAYFNHVKTSLLLYDLFVEGIIGILLCHSTYGKYLKTSFLR